MKSLDKIGIDLGGTKIEGILLDENYNVIKRKRIPTEQEKGYNSILEKTVALIQELKDLTKNQVSIGVATPGALSRTSGFLKNSNTQCLIGKPLKTDLEQVISQKISVENDANCFALAEAKMGAGKNFDFVFGIIMGTGVGGGIINNSKIHRGRTNIAGEWGHHVLFPNGNPCYCGNKGCVETYLSGPALEKRWTEITGQKKSLESIVTSIQGEKELLWKNEFLENFGMALANVIDILDPDVIVLGGGLSNISFLYDEGKNHVYQKVFSENLDTPIIKNQLGDSSGVFGACLLD